ncbi:enoyl-CoA hydratase/isomerase family protein [Pseudohoeflea suaedae]|uniref:3-hydroxyisobutyryl-CoA hydrolase n=1 Tax=Pseudohoeflea suaedae TaxID=877384 RepID=A0A4R5PQR4_9HYPH|nr:enoyl-CoA hydratase/isomerase family protein [Pseudohoeflea suaedae]TDH39298.1 enoyl-CoA hydratase/isomerase family protein [Pseudohoeflea suaedae]
MSAGDDILLRVEGRVGHATLNRPRALNALSYDMAMALEKALDDWRDDPAVDMVLIDAEGDKAFCAGGDINALYSTGKTGNLDYARTFWADEYRLNAKIAAFPKPYVALMDGIVMGGGVGVSAHGSHRIVTERTMLAMPECGIGLIPDVGGTWLLARAPSRIGEYLGLTGTRIGAADAIHAGFADTFVPSDRLEALKARLVTTADASSIAAFAAEPPEGELALIENGIGAAFSSPSVPDIAGALGKMDAEWAGKAVKAIDRGSPISLACTLEMVRAAREDASVAESLKREYRFVSRCMEDGDFIEGVRAAIIDKDRNPAFAGARKEMPAERVAQMLAPPPGGDIEIPV